MRPPAAGVLGRGDARRRFPGGGPAEAGAGPAPGHRESAAARLIELAQVNGKVQAQSIERVGELVKSNPQEALAVIRSMINGKA